MWLRLDLDPPTRIPCGLERLRGRLNKSCGCAGSMIREPRRPVRGGPAGAGRWPGAPRQAGAGSDPNLPMTASATSRSRLDGAIATAADLAVMPWQPDDRAVDQGCCWWRSVRIVES